MFSSIDKKKDRLQVLDDEHCFGQDQFEDVLSKQSTSINELRIPIPLCGIISLASLSKKNYHKVHSIIFAENGQITDVVDIPEGVENLWCEGNLLGQLKQLPKTLKDLRVSKNVLTKIDFYNEGAIELKHLYISYNDFVHLEGLPETLETLLCDHNQLKHLDLIHNTRLTKFHCNDNPHLILKNIPERINDCKYSAKLLQEGVILPEKHSDNVKASLESFFLMKNNYETSLMERHRERNHNLPACINCGKHEGMIFSCKNQKYEAHCGANPPCDWSLVIQRGNFTLDEMNFQTYWNTLEELKEDVIKQNMATLFRHVSETATKETFQEQMKAYTSFNEFLQTYINKRNSLFFDSGKEENQQAKEKEIHCLLEEVKQAIENEHIQDVVEIQYKHIKPLSNAIQKMQYEYMTTIEKNGYIYLIQNQEDMHNLETNLGESLSVL